jgi:dTDP-4-amino-4,6-dideoxygalactose transaminase
MIKMNDFQAEPECRKVEMFDAVRRVINSGSYILGAEVEFFEESWAKACGVKFGIGVANGMDAIELSLRAANIGPGDEVITTSMSAFASVLAILRAGATPVLADIDATTGLLSIPSARKNLSAKTKAVLLVHLYGQLCAMDEWMKFCTNNNLLLFEDCAQAHLSQMNGRAAGSFGLTGSFSFYPTKNLGALGDAGMIVTDDEDLSEYAKKLRNYGQSRRYEHPHEGMNSRLDEIQAAILSSRLKWLKDDTMKRQEIAKKYNSGINNNKITKMTCLDYDAHVYHLYVVKCATRNEFQRHLSQNGIITNLHYPVPISVQDALIGTQTVIGDVSVSTEHAKKCLSLPCHPQMTNEDVEKVIDVVNSY